MERRHEAKEEPSKTQSRIGPAREEKDSKGKETAGFVPFGATTYVRNGNLHNMNPTSNPATPRLHFPCYLQANPVPARRRICRMNQHQSTTLLPLVTVEEPIYLYVIDSKVV
jgi:hypothetical protein